jgi:phage terminase large subunit-like protein
MCAANAITVNDPAGNRKFTKQKSTGRIDGMQALAQAVGVMPQSFEDNSMDDFLANPITGRY